MNNQGTHVPRPGTIALAMLAPAMPVGDVPFLWSWVFAEKLVNKVREVVFRIGKDDHQVVAGYLVGSTKIHGSREST